MPIHDDVEATVSVTISENMVEVKGLRLRYWDGGAGPAVVLVHGIGASIEYWRFTLGPLSDYRRAIAIDLPGCGFSERGKTVPTLEETTDLMVGFLDALGLERATFVGNSLGGLVSLETALRHPDRVDRLILSNSAGLGREVNKLWRLVATPLIGPAIIEANRWLARHGRGNMFYLPGTIPPEMAVRYQQWISRPDLTDTLVGAARSGLDMGGQRPRIIRTKDLAKLAMPTLVVWGQNDPVIPLAHGERASKLIPNGRLVVIDRCGHCPQLERPDEFNRITRAFLEE